MGCIELSATVGNDSFGLRGINKTGERMFSARPGQRCEKVTNLQMGSKV